MSNTVKLLIRTLLILVLMIIGSWINSRLTLPDYPSIVTGYAVCLLIGILLGSMANPRFTKAKNKWIYILPILVFGMIGALMFLSPFLHVAAWPFGIGSYLAGFSSLSWTITGFFLSLALR